MMRTTTRSIFYASLLTMSSVGWTQSSETPPSLAESGNAVVTEFRDWTLQCLPAVGSQPETCGMVHNVVLDSGKRLMALQITETGTVAEPGKPSLVAVFSLPLGVYLPAGIQFTIDEKPPLGLAFERCDRGGCYAGVIVGEALGAALKEGVSGTARFSNLSGQTINAKLSLKGFTAAYNALLAKLG